MAKPQKKYSNLNTDEIKFIKKKLGITKIQDIDTAILKELKEALKKLKDSRNKNMISFKMWDVIICIILASFSDCNDWEDIHMFVTDNYIWLKSFLQMTGGIPKANSYERILSLVDKDELNMILFDFFKSLTRKLNPDIKLRNFDGRTNNGSKRNNTILSKEKTPLNCLNCYDNEYGYCIETIPIDDKTNEIPTIETLISGMNLTGIIATWDALNTQTKNVKAVVNAGGDYIIPVKANQEIFYNNLKLYFDEKRCEEIRAGNSNSVYYMENEKSHSAFIKYEYFQTSDINWYSKLSDWEGIHSFGLVKKSITKKMKVKNERKNAKKKMIEKIVTTTEYRYYISSKQVNIKEFSIATRQHWSVKNKIHWHLDFTFRQDNNSTTNKKALLNLEIIHKFILAILSRVQPRYKVSLKKIRKHLSNNFTEFLPELFCYFMLN